ncbi:hypothetical protein EV361DRAFT_967699 [Lentinula raphanica]|nr:hypothetical protein EV361DRAFT_967699 [Lentinula raphanica]
MGRKRSSGVLRRLYATRRTRSTSIADGPGFLYAYIDHGRQWKVGMTCNFERRKMEWDRQCPSSKRRWMPPIAVLRRRRAETLAHLLLENRCSERPRIYCPRCRKTHIEIFRFKADWRLTWRNIVQPLLIKAARAMVLSTNFAGFCWVKPPR